VVGLLSAKEEYDVVERYRNRAALTETILKEKVKEVKLLKGKVNVLQDVVKKLQLLNKKSIDNAESTAQDLNDKLQIQEQQRDALTNQMETLKLELNKAKSEIEAQANQNTVLVQQLKSKLEHERSNQQQMSKEHQENSNLNQQKIKALQQEVLDLDQSLEVTQSELKKLNRQLADREQELRSMQGESHRRQELLQHKLEKSLMEKEVAIKNQTLAEAQRIESVEIATSAVKAAEKREIALQQQLNDLQAKYEILLNEKQMIATEGANNSDDEVFQRQVDALQERLQRDRLLSESIRKLDQERFEAILKAERTKFEDQLKRLQIQSVKRVGDTPVSNNRMGQIWNRFRSPFRRK